MTTPSNTHQNSNQLIHETSPYLLQHAYNPVAWHPWGKEALEKANQENKPIIVSIGYSACHWCHVMEKESFENEQIAKLMSEQFVCIKVDREERPDIDAIYMDALHAMGLQGGWPLNVFLLPNKKPFYGGTYFPPQNWYQLLASILQAYQNNLPDLEDSANAFAQTLNQSEKEKYNLIAKDNTFALEELKQMYYKLSKNFDTQRGGMQKAPKFPMPSITFFLLHYYQITQNEEVLTQIHKNLKSMAYGGIYDAVGGGFARYSVDAEWFAPHFEKMLYDNAQLIQLYTEAYQLTKKPLYKEIVYESIQFLEREMRHASGAFFSALDADSEGIEGKFYVWTWQELLEILGETELQLFAQYFQVKEKGNWEHNYNILHKNRDLEDQNWAKILNLDEITLKNKVKDWKEKILKTRETRIRPHLDDKILTSWNGLILKALAEAYRVFGEAHFLKLALENAKFIQEKLKEGEKLWHQFSYKNEKASLEGYLEDYALVIEAYTALYQATFDIQWIKEADNLLNYTLTHFYDEKEGLFFFSKANEELIARKKEIFDNVIPASNSIMAKNLYELGTILANENYINMAKQMLLQVKKMMLTNIEHLANWATLYYMQVTPTVEIAMLGKDLEKSRKQIDTTYFPNKVVIGSVEKTTYLPLLAYKEAINNQSTFYVCFNKTCYAPVHSAEEVWQLVEKIEK